VSGSLFEELVAVMEKLRGPDGCPWDQKQTHQSIRHFLLEETYETYEAIKEKKWDNLKEELGDLLFHILFHAQLGKEAGEFDINDIIRGIRDKLKNRHPHVFGNARVRTVKTQTKKWDEYKSKESSISLLERVPKKHARAASGL